MNNRADNSQQGGVKGDAPRTRGRGNFWEITYRASDPAFESWSLTKGALWTETGKTNVQITTEPDTRAVNLSERSFVSCDFNHFTLADSSFTDCAFVDCRFVKSNFNHVKFSKCRFDKCHFLNVRFQNCQFLDCTFSNISASAELLLFIESAISPAAFVDALVTNLAALPKGTDPNYQNYRLLSTKAKIAGRILLSLRDEPDPSAQSDANRCFEIALQRRQIAEARWTTDGGKLVKRNPFFRTTVLPLRAAALWMMRMAGFFTDWGRSPLKSLWFLLGAFGVFSGIYILGFQQDLEAALLRALDCTFVFGYTKYPLQASVRVIDYIMFINSFIGLWWYALLIPALSKRLFR